MVIGAESTADSGNSCLTFMGTRFAFCISWGFGPFFVDFETGSQDRFTGITSVIY